VIAGCIVTLIASIGAKFNIYVGLLNAFALKISALPWVAPFAITFSSIIGFVTCCLAAYHTYAKIQELKKIYGATEIITHQNDQQRNDLPETGQRVEIYGNVLTLYD